MCPEAIASFKKALAALKDEPAIQASLPLSYASCGMKIEASGWKELSNTRLLTF